MLLLTTSIFLHVDLRRGHRGGSHVGWRELCSSHAVVGEFATTNLPSNGQDRVQRLTKYISMAGSHCGSRARRGKRVSHCSGVESVDQSDSFHPATPDLHVRYRTDISWISIKRLFNLPTSKRCCEICTEWRHSMCGSHPPRDNPIPRHSHRNGGHGSITSTTPSS